MYNNEYYIYHKNITGEIIAILKNHQVVARYVYDAWGKHTVYNGDGTINNYYNDNITTEQKWASFLLIPDIILYNWNYLYCRFVASK